MTTGLLLSIPLLPLLLALFVKADSHRWLPVLAAAGAAAAALLLPVGTTLYLAWLLLGVHLAFDETARLFLAFSALAWLLAALYRALAPETLRAPRRFTLFFLLAMAGNLLLLLAADMLGFYVGFALMGLAAYGLMPGASQSARRAARVYLGFTLVGELLLFVAIATLYAHTGSLLFSDLTQLQLPPTAVVLLLLGFGIKVALPGLHGWLPMVYATAPAVAVAVLSGPMMKAGLLGWLRFLPAGGADEIATTALTLLGTAGVLLGVGVGLMQRRPGALLGYSSIAKMGLMSALFATALASPQAAPAMLAALTLLALHHLLVKSTFFLGLAEWGRRGAAPLVLAGMLVLASAMVAVPFSGGAAVKAALGEAFDGPMSGLLTLSAVGTMLLMIRLWLLLRRPSARQGGVDGAALLWLAALPTAFWAPFWPTAIGLGAGGLSTIAAGLALFLLGSWLGRWSLQQAPRVARPPAPGDMVPWLFAAYRRQRHMFPPVAELLQRLRGGGAADAAPSSLALPGLALLLVAAALLLSLWTSV
jgi:formate hydrogenlyase subunit 3/multisubunit Na+/H+ antiporter MnhD subunit